MNINEEGVILFIDTKYFGKTEIDENQIITFPKGLPAFEDHKEFSLLALPENSLYYCLQSTTQPDIAFLLIDPWDFFPKYDIHIPQVDLKELSIENQEQVQVYNIITIPQNPNDMSANLLGPIVINKATLRAKQIILHESEYHTKHFLLKREAV